MAFWRLVLENHVEGVNDTGEVTEDSEEDVDEEISTAATLEEDTQRGEDDGKDDLADIAGGERHDDGFVVEAMRKVCW
jgi:hypothetical protein